jgi:hypothetical protein
MTAFDPPFEKLFCEDFNGGFRFKGRVNTFNLSHSRVGNVNINRTSLTFFVFDPADAMYATAYLLFFTNVHAMPYNKNLTDLSWTVQAVRKNIQARSCCIDLVLPIYKNNFYYHSCQWDFATNRINGNMTIMRTGGPFGDRELIKPFRHEFFLQTSMFIDQEHKSGGITFWTLYS